MTTQSISISFSPKLQRFSRRAVAVFLILSTIGAGRLFIAVERDGITRWLIFILCIVAILQMTVYRQPLLAISCYLVLICYWLLFLVANGGIALFAAAVIGGALGGCAVWFNHLWQNKTAVALIVAIVGCGIVTSSYVPTSLIVSTTVAVAPVLLLLPLVLTRERCSNAQYLTLLFILVLAAWSVTSSAILFT